MYGIGRYIAASTNEHELISSDKLIEREGTPDSDPAEPVHPPHLPHVPPTIDEKNSLHSDSEIEQRIISELKGLRGRSQRPPETPHATPNEYGHLIETQDLPNIGQYYR